MTKLSDIRDNLKNSPPRLLKVIDQLLEWCDPVNRDGFHACSGRDRILLHTELMERGLYPYKPGSRPVDILGDGITPRGPYRELGFVVDDYLVGMLTGDVYDNILRLIEREGALFLPARGNEESVRDFLLRMRAWCLRVRPDHSEAVGSPAEPDDLVTFTVALGLFHVSRPTLQRGVADGKIPSFRKGEKGPHLVRQSDLDRLFTRRK